MNSSEVENVNYRLLFSLFQAVESLHQSNGPSPQYSFQFLNYAQSNNCELMSDSSVSYAAGALMKQ